MPPRSRSPISSIELDTMPFAGMMLLLIPMLLASAQFVSLATVDVGLPAIVIGTPGGSKPIDLTVAVHPQGFTVSAAQHARATLGWADAVEVPLGSDGHDLPALSEVAAEVKRAFPDSDTLIIVPDDSVPFELLIATMDATREAGGEALFGGVTLASVTR